MAKQTRDEVANALVGHQSENVIFSGNGARIVMITAIYRGGVNNNLTTLASFRVEFLKSERKPEHTISLDGALDIAMDCE
jgi:hypothetical protein